MERRRSAKKARRQPDPRSSILHPPSSILNSPSSILHPRSLLRWFAAQQRDLPWRRDRDPYRIWVSEVMLQQTQVATVVPYFERFMATWPTLADLARAEEQAVLRLWEGLGYYRRARHLHQAARRLMTEHGGTLPDDPQVWRGLPGVGRYMVGAILSQAFDRRLPIVEANSQRVLCRLFGQRLDPREGPGRQWVWQAAEAVLPRRRVGDFNQALMELGALVCTPAKPACLLCPLAERCVARRAGLQETIPVRARKPEPVEVRELAVVIRRGDQVLLAQRPDQGRWAAMWEFPHTEVTGGSPVRLIAALTGLAVALGDRFLQIRHGVTHHRITLDCFAARYRRGRFRSSLYPRARWLKIGELHDLPVSAPQRRLIQALQQAPQP
jgi:A/G-specific adenine glycosylase